MDDKLALTILIALLVVGVGTFMFTWANSNQEIEATVDLTEVNAKLDETGTLLVALDTRVAGLEVTEPVAPVDANGTPVAPVSSGDYMRNQAEYEDDMEEAEALRLAEESVNLDDRDFRKAMFNALLDFGVDIDDRDDILSVEYETDVDGDEVEFDKFRVYYFIDGFEDKTEDAKLNDFIVEVDDLDFDEDFDDAEVNEDYMDDLMVLKVYD